MTPAFEPTRRDWLVAWALTAAVVVLVLVRLSHAGALWRDEAGAAQLASLPQLTEVLHLFPHEAFPPPFVLGVRLYQRLTGGSDFALRLLGCAVGFTILALLWVNAKRTTRHPPWISLVLLGFDAPFLIYSESVRGYGAATVFLLLTYQLLARVLDARAESPGTRRESWGLGLAVFLSALASVQVLLSSFAFVLALCGAAALVAAWQRRLRTACWLALCGPAASLSLLPWAHELLAARREWSIVLVQQVEVRKIWSALMVTIGTRPALFVWLLLVAVALAAVARRALLGRPQLARPAAAEAPSTAGESAWQSPFEEGIAADRASIAGFAGLTMVGAILAGGFFLKMLAYPPRPWYFLPMMALVASSLDTVFGSFSRADRRPVTVIKVSAVAIVIASQAFPVWQQVAARQTNIDLVARELAVEAAPEDLVVVVPWYYGVSFNRYYEGKARWETLPDISDHRLHRYDLLKTRLESPRPISDVVAAVTATLRGHHRVWLVGEPRWPSPDEKVTELAPAPGAWPGWHDAPYVAVWAQMLGLYLEQHGAAISRVAVADDRRVNSFEDLSVAVVQGWR
jgi:hypothetical protein